MDGSMSFVYLMHEDEHADDTIQSCQWFPQHSTDLQVEVTRHDMLQWASKRREIDCELVNTDVNNAGFKTLKNVLWKCFTR